VLNDIVGDSALQLNKSKGTVGFEAELKALLGPHVEIIRFPGEGAGAILVVPEYQARHCRSCSCFFLWQVPPAFDVWAEAARRVVRDRPSGTRASPAAGACSIGSCCCGFNFTLQAQPVKRSSHMCTDGVGNVNVVAKVMSLTCSSRNINIIPRTECAWVLVHGARCRCAWLEPGSAGPLLL
jgi:hypothetical protein